MILSVKVIYLKKIKDMSSYFYFQFSFVLFFILD